MNTTDIFTTHIPGIHEADHITAGVEKARSRVSKQWDELLAKRSELQATVGDLTQADVAEVDTAALMQLPARMLDLIKAEITVREAAQEYFNGPAKEATRERQHETSEAFKKTEAEAIQLLVDAGFKGRLLARTARERDEVVKAYRLMRSADGYAGSLNQWRLENTEAIDKLKGQARKLINTIVVQATPSLTSAAKMGKPATGHSFATLVG